MPPTARPLDSEFQPQDSPLPPPPADGAEMVIQDFNAFFERLSSLDDVRWNEDSGAVRTPAEPRAPAAAPAQAEPKLESAPQVPSAPEPTAALPKPAMKADAPIAPASATVKPALAAMSTPAVRSARVMQPRRGMPLGFKLTMTALVLFGVGMGAGWMALSLPKTADRDRLVENPLVPMDWPAKGTDSKTAANADTGTRPDAAAPPPALAAATPKDAAKTPTAKAQTAADTMVPPAPPAPPAEAAVALPKTVSVAANAAPLGAPVEPSAGDTGTASSTAAAAPADSLGSAATGRSPAAVAAPAAAGRYAVQVGACGSAKCVENYRAMVAPLVEGHAVQVVEQAAAQGAVQRVRIGGLTRDQAMALRESLERADARLKHAYVVKLAEKS